MVDGGVVNVWAAQDELPQVSQETAVALALALALKIAPFGARTAVWNFTLKAGESSTALKKKTPVGQNPCCRVGRLN